MYLPNADTVSRVCCTGDLSTDETLSGERRHTFTVSKQALCHDFNFQSQNVSHFSLPHNNESFGILSVLLPGTA